MFIQKTLDANYTHLLELLNTDKVTVHFLNSSGIKNVLCGTLKNDVLSICKPNIQEQVLKKPPSNLIRVFPLTVALI
jgi:hypothetical protein